MFQLLLYAGVPEILDLVVRTSGQTGCNLRPPVAENGMQVYDQLFFLGRKCTAFGFLQVKLNFDGRGNSNTSRVVNGNDEG